MELCCKVGTRFPGVNSKKSWENGDIIEIRWDGFYKLGTLNSKHHCIIRLPLIDYWSARSDTHWKSTKKQVLKFKKFESSVNSSGKFPWETNLNFERDICRINYIDYEWLLKQKYITESQYDAIYDPTRVADISLSITNLMKIVKTKGLHARIDPKKLLTHGSISSGTYQIGAEADYATIASFEADIAGQLTGDLTAEHQNEETAISSFVTFDIETGSYLLKLTAKSGAEHNGGPYGNGARINTGTNDSIYFNEANEGTLKNVEVSKIAFDVSGSSNLALHIKNCGKDGIVTINRLLIKGDPNSNYGIRAVAYNIILRNNIIYGVGNVGLFSGINLNTGNYTDFAYVYNNTCIDCYYGFWSGGNGTNLVFKNNISQAARNSDYGGVFGTNAKNISEDDTSPNSSYRSKDLHTNSVFFDYANNDYRIDRNGDAVNLAIIDDGENLSGVFTDDIANDTGYRPVEGNWDIGASQRDPVKASTVKIFTMNNNILSINKNIVYVQG